ncbi:protein translocase subunit SecF [Angelakisella massiliensis]|uniref:protein translocase subunit SecF n=1 Tax=Angelakisella massiliensis TaxID=1871018 RepID=UPI0008F95D8B|nr:protein translocase subunit SecF [Angelakisella massiliensis]
MFDFIGKRKIFFSISLGLLALCLVFCLTLGVELDIQFKGGSMMTYSYTGTVDPAAIESAVEDVTGSVTSVQTGSTAGTGMTTFTIALAQKQGVDVETQSAITAKLEEMYPDAGLEALSINNVDATIGKEFFLKSILAVLLASVLMVVYIAWRFRNIGGWSAGVMAMLALLHDVLMVFAIFVFLRIPLNDSFIAVVLTILGYSLNDTIVIYDRIRENERLMGKRTPLPKLVNESINQSLGRAFGTSFATVLSMVVVAVVAWMYDMNSIITFAIPMIAGIVSGLYSSVCITGPLWVWWEEKHPSKRRMA